MNFQRINIREAKHLSRALLPKFNWARIPLWEMAVTGKAQET
jgi:hypothetical protein